MVTQTTNKKVYSFIVENGYGARTVVETEAESIIEACVSASDYICSKQMQLSEMYIDMVTKATPAMIATIREQHYMLADLTIISISERDKL